jgi:hypothetical protein
MFFDGKSVSGCHGIFDQLPTLGVDGVGYIEMDFGLPL